MNSPGINPAEPFTVPAIAVVWVRWRVTHQTHPRVMHLLIALGAVEIFYEGLGLDSFCVAFFFCHAASRVMVCFRLYH